VEHLADGAWSPAVLAAAGRGDPFGIELLGDACDAPAFGGPLEDATDHGRLCWIDHSSSGGAVCPATRSRRAASGVALAVALAARDIAASRQTQERIVSPLLCPLALHLGGESGERQHDLLGGRVERALPVVEVVKDPNPGVQDLLDDVGGLDL